MCPDLIGHAILQLDRAFHKYGLITRQVCHPFFFFFLEYGEEHVSPFLTLLHTFFIQLQKKNEVNKKRGESITGGKRNISN